MRRGLTRRLPRGRRGATLPFVCIMLAALLGAAAMGIDLARLYYSAAEVQTAADAAALAAARFQQYNTLSGLANVQARAQWLASLNLSGGQPVTVLSSDVVPVTYNPATRAIAPSSWTSETYAFTVTAQAAVPGIVGGTARTVRRSATAWIANVNGANCVRPIAINYTRFYEEGVTHDRRYSSAGTFAPDFNFWDISSTQRAGSDLKRRTYIVLPPWAIDTIWKKKTPPSGYENGATGYPSHGNWEPVDYTNVGSGTGALSPFGYALGGPERTASCTGNTAVVGDVKKPWVARPTPAGSNTSQSDSAYLIRAANEAMVTLCNRTGTASNAFCYDSAGEVGVKTRVMLTDSVVTNGVWTHKVREVGRARVMCYFQSVNDVCNPQPMDEPPSTVGTWTSWGPLKGYPPGTFMILLDTPGSTDITRDLVLGTKPGLTQRVLLAK